MSVNLRRRDHNSPSGTAPQRGFTLIEVMIVVGIVAILASIAVPSYRDYILRGQLVDATTGLATMRADMERYYQDNRTYQTVTTSGGTTFVPPCAPANVRTVGKFRISCPTAGDLQANQYRIRAEGFDAATGFTFWIDSQGLQSTEFVPPSWGTAPASCWLLKRGQVCT